jgi:NADH-quinone oxidoreductase subunit G
MAKLINLIIDDQPVTVPAGTLVVDAAKQIGNDIPVFCYHPKMEPVGMCRMCLVEIGRPIIDRATGEFLTNEDGTPRIQFGPKLDTACTTPVSEGMVVRTSTPKVVGARREILEFLLTSHPLDCPICDKGGECPLQNLTLAHGPGNSRFLLDEKIHLAKHYPLGEQIILDRERCIQCSRCVRFQNDIAGDPVIGFSQRGRALQIVTFSEPGFDSYFSGNTTDICPVGALTTTDFRFGARPWELKPVASICTHCPVGCNLTLNTRREAVSAGQPVIKRVLPRQNEEVNEIWICDKGRWAYHFAEDSERLTAPLIRRNGTLVKATWEEALDLVAQRLKDIKGADAVFLAGGRLPNEDLFNLRKLADGLGGTPALYSNMAGGDWTARIGFSPDSNIASMGRETAIIVVASDLENEAPIWYLRLRQAAKRGANLIVINPRATKLDRVARHVIRYAYGSEAGALRAFFPGAEVPETFQEAVKAFSAAENAVIFFGSEGLGLEGSRALADACAALLLATNHTGRSNNGLVGVWSKANLQGAWDMGFTPVADLPAALRRSPAVYIAAADPAGDSPILAQALEAAGFVVVQELFLTETARLADVVLPVQSFIEREGTFTSGERRVQRFYPAIPAPGSRGPKADFGIIAEIARRLELDIEGRAASLVMARIAGEIGDYAGLSYTRLAQVKPQWPIVHRGDLYYGGTSYENRQGLGVPLQPAITSGRWSYDPANPPAPAVVPQPAPQQGEVWLVPITRLYDCGRTVASSQILRGRIARPELWMHPDTAEALRLSTGAQAAVSLEGQEIILPVRLDETLPRSVALIPRSTGVPLSGPRAVAAVPAPKLDASSITG